MSAREAEAVISTSSPSELRYEWRAASSPSGSFIQASIWARLGFEPEGPQ